MLWCESSKDCILLGLIDSDTYLHEFRKLVQNKCEWFHHDSNSAALHTTSLAWNDHYGCIGPLQCQSSLVIWQPGEVATLPSPCQHPVEVTPRTSRSSQMRPRGDDGNLATGLSITLRLRGGALLLCSWPRMLPAAPGGCVSNDPASPMRCMDLLWTPKKCQPVQDECSPFANGQATTMECVRQLVWNPQVK